MCSCARVQAHGMCMCQDQRTLAGVSASFYHMGPPSLVWSAFTHCAISPGRRFFLLFLHLTLFSLLIIIIIIVLQLHSYTQHTGIAFTPLYSLLPVAGVSFQPSLAASSPQNKHTDALSIIKLMAEGEGCNDFTRSKINDERVFFGEHLHRTEGALLCPSYGISWPRERSLQVRPCLMVGWWLRLFIG